MPTRSDVRFALLRETAARLAVGSVSVDWVDATLETLRATLGARRVVLRSAADPRAGASADGDDEAALTAPDEIIVRHPLSAGGDTFGVLEVMHPEGIETDDLGLIAGIADCIAVAIAREQRLGELEREITARVREIADQRAFIECVVDSLPVGLYVVDRDYRIHAWNHKRETGLQGVSRTDAIGRTIFEVLHRQPAALLKGEFDDVFASGRLQQFQMESSAFGDVRSFRISKIPMRMGGAEVTHVITIGEDITDWKAAIDRTAQSEKLAALGQLAAGVMHEINNPLATIAACAESIALQRELDGWAANAPSSGNGASPDEFLRIIDLEVQRCKRIVNGLLDFSRPKPASRETLELNGVVSQGLFLLRHHPKYKRVQMVTDLQQESPLFIEGDGDQLVQVLIALVINAMDAAPEGSRVVVRTVRGTGADGRRAAALEVADEGPGIPRSLQAKVFEPFFTTKAPGQGTGLGLAICYGIVNDHGGQLELVPADVGATFRVTLPESALMQGVA